jgi:hypothetical protein
MRGAVGLGERRAVGLEIDGKAALINLQDARAGRGGDGRDRIEIWVISVDSCRLE